VYLRTGAIVVVLATACTDASPRSVWARSRLDGAVRVLSHVVRQTGVACAHPRPEWLWCDDFEHDRLGSYFEYQDDGGSFVRSPGTGVHGSTSMRARWRAGQVQAGSLKLAFGRTPSAYLRPVDAGTSEYRNIYWRVFVRAQSHWATSGADKFTRAIVMAADDWSEAAIGHVWSGSGPTTQDYYVLDPARGTTAAGTVATIGYNDFANFAWLGAARGSAPVLARTGEWYCVEAHMRLNTPGMSDGVFELWVNGSLDAQRTGLDWVGRYTEYGINTLFLENYINKGAARAQVRDYDDLVVSTEPIGCRPL
jgi:hypothetical protein